MAVGDVYQVQVNYNIGSERTMNVLHLREMLASTDDIPAQTVAIAVYTLWASRYAATLFSSEASVVLIQEIGRAHV